ncbi:MAG: ABC1 kinase family protein [Candidatus Nanohaloarchaea archaeon]
MNFVKDDVEDLERFEDILHILFDEGFGFLLDRLDLMHRIPVVKRLKKPRKKKPGPERVRETFEKLGPTFIKFGQILAQRPDVIPPEYAEELEKLEDSVPAFDPEEARDIVDEEIGMNTFSEFSEEPIAAASIAQVHEATLQNGDEVVVKVRRPGIKEQMHEDLDILLFLAKEFDKHSNMARGMAYQDVKEFSEWTQEELDLEKEGRNAQVMKENLEDEDRIKIPEAYLEHSTEKVLVMEKVSGVRSNNAEAIRQMDVSTEEIAMTGIRSALKQIIRDGFFHADPHPSNFLVNEDGELIYLDFGMVGKFSKEMRKNIALLILHAYDEDVDGLVETIHSIGYSEEEPDLEGLKKEVEKISLRLKNTTIEEQSISKALIELTMAAADHGIYMPSSLMIGGKALVTVEGIGLAIYPDFKPQDEFTEVVEQLLIDLNQPEELTRSFMIDLTENRDLITKLPSKLNRLAEQQEKTVKVETRNDGREELTVAALIVGSSLLLMNSLPSKTVALIAALELVAAVLLLRRF